MAKNQITWTKEQRRAARDEDKSLIAFGSDIPHKGAIRLTSPIDHEMASVLTLFMLKAFVSDTPIRDLPGMLESAMDNYGYSTETKKAKKED